MEKAKQNFESKIKRLLIQTLFQQLNINIIKTIEKQNEKSIFKN